MLSFLRFFRLLCFGLCVSACGHFNIKMNSAPSSPSSDIDYYTLAIEGPTAREVRAALNLDQFESADHSFRVQCAKRWFRDVCAFTADANTTRLQLRPDSQALIIQGEAAEALYYSMRGDELVLSASTSRKELLTAKSDFLLSCQKSIVSECTLEKFLS